MSKNKQQTMAEVFLGPLANKGAKKNAAFILFSLDPPPKIFGTFEHFLINQGTF